MVRARPRRDQVTAWRAGARVGTNRRRRPAPEAGTEQGGHDDQGYCGDPRLTRPSRWASSRPVATTTAR